MKILNLFKKEVSPKKEVIDYEADSYWIQKVPLSKINHRLPYFREICKDKKVIHFGCTDWPVFDASVNLHIELEKYASVIHGFDIDKEGIANLKQYVDQEYFSDFKEIKDTDYDICLVPETIEHVDNVRTFLEGLSTIKAKKFLITAPNCFAPVHMERNLNTDNMFYELVHQDHNCWYSPFTLKNQIEKYSKFKVTKVYLIEEERMICCEAEYR